MRWLLVLSCLAFWGGIHLSSPPEVLSSATSETNQQAFNADWQSWPQERVATSSGVRLVEEHEDEEVNMLQAEGALPALHLQQAQAVLPMQDKFVREKTHYPPPETRTLIA